MKVIYSSNNSGGDWWLTDQNWFDLEKAGWKVEWTANDKNSIFKSANGRWLGALATEASREGLTLEAAVREFESITGEDADAMGCECCGQPHYFYEERKGS